MTIAPAGTVDTFKLVVVEPGIIKKKKSWASGIVLFIVPDGTVTEPGVDAFTVAVNG